MQVLTCILTEEWASHSDVDTLSKDLSSNGCLTVCLSLGMGRTGATWGLGEEEGNTVSLYCITWSLFLEIMTDFIAYQRLEIWVSDLPSKLKSINIIIWNKAAISIFSHYINKKKQLYAQKFKILRWI